MVSGLAKQKMLEQKVPYYARLAKGSHNSPQRYKKAHVWLVLCVCVYVYVCVCGEGVCVRACVYVCVW